MEDALVLVRSWRYKELDLSFPWIEPELISFLRRYNTPTGLELPIVKINVKAVEKKLSIWITVCDCKTY